MLKVIKVIKVHLKTHEYHLIGISIIFAHLNGDIRKINTDRINYFRKNFKSELHKEKQRDHRYKQQVQVLHLISLFCLSSSVLIFLRKYFFYPYSS